MVKRAKRLKKGINSLKKEIEEHFAKVEKDILDDNIDRGRYHVKEIDKSLLAALEIKIKILGLEDSAVQDYRKRLQKLKKSLELDSQ